MMKATDIQEYARQMWERSGAKAVAEAAQKARGLEASGAKDEAETWRRIEAALKLMNGPHVS